MILMLSACASVQVKSTQELFNTPEDYAKKECYAYDNTRKNMSRNIGPAIGIGIIGGLLGPFGIPFILAASAVSSTVDYTTLPVKCGLTIDEAAKEAWTMAYYEDSISQWWQKGLNNPYSISANPIARNSDCLLAALTVNKSGQNEERSKSYVNRMELCKNTEGILLPKKENISEIDFNVMKDQYNLEKEGLQNEKVKQETVKVETFSSPSY